MRQINTERLDFPDCTMRWFALFVGLWILLSCPGLGTARAVVGSRKGQASYSVEQTAGPNAVVSGLFFDERDAGREKRSSRERRTFVEF
jgi:hypothetical protein